MSEFDKDDKQSKDLGGEIVVTEAMIEDIAYKLHEFVSENHSIRNCVSYLKEIFDFQPK